MDGAVSRGEALVHPLAESVDKAAEGGPRFVDDVLIGRERTSVINQGQLIGNNKNNTLVLYFVLNVCQGVLVLKMLRS